MTKLKFRITYMGEVPMMQTEDFFGTSLSVAVDERRSLLHYKNVLKARAIRCYLIGHFKRRIKAFEIIGVKDQILIDKMKAALNSLQYDTFTNYEAFRTYIYRYQHLVESTLPKKQDKSHLVTQYIFENL